MKTVHCDEIIEIPSEDEIEKNVIKEEPQLSCKNQIKFENEYLEYEAFNVKQEYLGSNECIELDSESDSDSENWVLRLSQSSPGKPFTPVERKSIKKDQEINNSYSQLDDFVDCMDTDENKLHNDDFSEDMMHDIISIPQHPPETQADNEDIKIEDNNLEYELSSPSMEVQTNNQSEPVCKVDELIDGNYELLLAHEAQADVVRKAQLIEPLAQDTRKRNKQKGTYINCFLIANYFRTS